MRSSERIVAIGAWLDDTGSRLFRGIFATTIVAIALLMLTTSFLPARQPVFSPKFGVSDVVFMTAGCFGMFACFYPMIRGARFTGQASREIVGLLDQHQTPALIAAASTLSGQARVVCINLLRARARIASDRQARLFLLGRAWKSATPARRVPVSDLERQQRGTHGEPIFYLVIALLLMIGAPIVVLSIRFVFDLRTIYAGAPLVRTPWLGTLLLIFFGLGFLVALPGIVRQHRDERMMRKPASSPEELVERWIDQPTMKRGDLRMGLRSHLRKDASIQPIFDRLRVRVGETKTRWSMSGQSFAAQIGAPRSSRRLKSAVPGHTNSIGLTVSSAGVSTGTVSTIGWFAL